MGTSTVSGPFRSANGFQELVNGQWVPVAGGGGGGGIPVIVLSEENVYGSFSGGVTGGVINLPQLNVGQSLRIVGNAMASWAYSDFVWKIVPYLNAGADFSFINPEVVITQLPDPYTMVSISISGGSFPFPPDTLYVYKENLNVSDSMSLNWISFEITYLGLFSAEGITGGIYQISNIPFIGYYGNNDGTSLIDWFHDPLVA